MSRIFKINKKFKDITSIIALLILVKPVFAQDTTNNFEKGKYYININTNNNIEDSSKIIRSNSMIELKSSRLWIPNSLNEKTNTMNVINLQKPNLKFIDSDLFYIVVGSAIAFGATAAYMKFEADDYYDKYKSTNNKKYKDSTDKYDLYSGIALGAMEINFGYLIYRLLSD